MNVQEDALRKAAWAIELFLSSVSIESDNYAGGIEKMNLIEALNYCKQALGVAGSQSGKSCAAAGDLLDALQISTIAYVKTAMKGVVEVQPVSSELERKLRILVRQCFQDGFRAGVRFMEENHHEQDQTQS